VDNTFFTKTEENLCAKHLEEASNEGGRGKRPARLPVNTQLLVSSTVDYFCRWLLHVVIEEIVHGYHARGNFGYLFIVKI